MLQILKILAVIYICLVCVITIFQRKLQYFPDTKPTINHSPEEVSEIEIEGQKHWLIKNKDSKNIIVFFHGNAGNISHRLYKGMILKNMKINVLLAEYPGYGSNPGKISEKNFYLKANNIMKWLIYNGYPERKIVVYGESIGTGVATEMATRFNIAALILEAPLYSAVHTAKDLYPYLPVSILMRDKYENFKKIQQIKTPLLILHGKKDKVLSYDKAIDLYNLAHDPKTFITVKEGGHNDLYDFDVSSEIEKFLENLDYNKEEKL